MNPRSRSCGRSAATLAVGMILVASNAMANGTITTTEYSTNALIRVVIAVIGGIVAVFGISLASKNAGALSNVSLSRKSFNLKGVSQGVVVTLLGAAVLIAGLYFLPEKTLVTETTGKSIKAGPGGVIVKE